MRAEGLAALKSGFTLKTILNRVVLKAPNLKESDTDVLQKDGRIGARSGYFGSLGQCFIKHQSRRTSSYEETACLSRTN
jgi:hypothetical protein